LVAQIVVTPTTYDHAHDGALHIGTQDEENKNTTQPREAGNIGYPRTKKNKNTTQPREAGNIGYTRRRKTKQKTQHNLEKLAT
jgi:hypothetical protein